MYTTILLLLYINLSQTYIPIPTYSENSDVNKCLKNIIHQNFNTSKYIFGITDDAFENIFKNLVDIKILFKVGKQINFLKTTKHIDVYIILVKTTKIEDIFQYLRNIKIWNPKSKFLITSLKENSSEILNKSYKNYVLNVAVVEINKNHKCEVHFWGRSTGCEKPTKINTISCEHNLKIAYEKKPAKLFTNCTLKLLIMQIAPYTFYNKRKGKYDGIEILCLATLQEKLEFKIENINHSFNYWGIKSPNGNYTDMLGLLQYFQADLLVGMCPPNQTWYEDFDNTFSYLTDYLVWIVPKANLQPYWLKLVTAYPTIIWILIIVLLIIFPLLWYKTSKILWYKERICFQEWHFCQMNVYQMLVGVSVLHTPRSSAVRVLFAVWIIATMILITVYQSQLVSALTRPLYEPQISTNEELFKSDLKIGLTSNIFALFSDKYKDEKELLRRAILCDISTKCPNRTAFVRDFALAKSYRAAEYLKLKYYTSTDGTPLIYLFKSSFFFHSIQMIFTKGHPIFDRFNEIIIRLHESGFFMYWFKTIERETLSANQDVVVPDNSPQLNIHEMLPPFLFLVLGLSLSLLVFLLEIIYNKFKVKP